jgi:hypothetical protein
MIVGLLGWWYVSAALHHVAPLLTSINRAFTKKKAKKRRNSARRASIQPAMAESRIPERIGVQ